MAKGELVLFLLLLAVGANKAQNSYFITFPKTLIPGSNLDISIDILKDNITVPVEATIERSFYNLSTYEYDIIPLQTVSGNFYKGETGTLSLPIKPDIECQYCTLRIRGRGALQFEDSAYVDVNSQTVSVLIQTDKAIYRPSQTVLYRALAVYTDLTLYKGQFNIEIRDPNQNKIKVLLGLEGASGVVEGSFDLSDQTLLGTWSVTVTLEVDTELVSVNNFKIWYCSYSDLPMFEVTVELPPYGLVDDTVLTGKVKAKYTFGQPVIGMVELHVGQNVLLRPDTCVDSAVKTTQISFEVNGESSFTIPKEDLQRSVNVFDGSDIRVTAFVTETTTGIRLNGSSVVKFYRNEFQVKFLDKTPNVFKPGLPYTAFIQVFSPDQMPPPGSNNVISAYTSVTYTETVPDQELYGTLKFTGTYPFPGQNLTLPASGLLPIDIDVPKNATSINIKVTFGSVSVTKNVYRTYSKSLNYIQLSLLDKNVKVCDDVRVNVVGTEPLRKLTYEVLSRGSILNTGRLDGKGDKEFTFTLNVTSSMAPTAHLVVYYDRNNDEIVADSLAFNVDGLFDNKVSIAFGTNETQPGDEVDVVLTADPKSRVHILAIDQSVLLLKIGNDITPEKVKSQLSSHDSHGPVTTLITRFSRIIHNSHQTIRTVHSQLSSYNSHGPFKTLITRFSRLMQDSYGALSSDDSILEDYVEDSQGASSNLQVVEKVRQFFPETWIWNSSEIGSDGKAILKTTVPDTITSWVASAFATNMLTGLGVAPTTSMLRVFKSFFVSLNYPRSVVRNEQFVVQATVFNYLREDLTVKVTLKNQEKFKSVKISKDGTESLVTGNQEIFVTVKTDKQAVAYFPILATTLGLVDIEVTAQTTIAADGVSRQIVVKPEGAPVNYNVPVFVNLQNTSSQLFERNISFTLPASVVDGSENSRVKATGDLIGSSLSSLTSLITLPTGCGEQVMVKLAPVLHVSQYLNASGQLTDVLKREILESLEEGYQRILTYKRYDNGFSPFGNYDKSGSTWLTAFTSRILSEAREYIYVDPFLLIRSNKWMIDRQNLDGSFNEFGKILDRNTQGTGTGPSLTAFVLLSLLEAKDLFIQPSCPTVYVCRDFYLWGNATMKAQSNLENLVASNAIEEKFSLAVVSYALSKAKSPAAKRVFDKLLAFSKNEGNILYWQANSTVTDAVQARYGQWRPPRIQARPIDILITSYAILTFTELGRLDEALPAVRWLTAQRNAQGGFSSTQDTVVGLQALSSYASKSLRPDTQLNIQVTGPSVLAAFNVTRDNALSLQIKQLSGAPKEFVIGATGNGIALVDIDYRFNVNEELATPSFDVNTILLDDKLDLFNLMICTKYVWLLQRETGMVVQEISIPSGFKPDLSSLGAVAGLRRSERQGDVVAIYFDKIGSTSLCYSVKMIRESKVARSQPSYVRTFGYYDPGRWALSKIIYHRIYSRIKTHTRRQFTRSNVLQISRHICV
ncbi:unnamed protein product [Lymnaea stagnalis]|uniref:Uncharacterized protein n=1 Tax=Lymnaea stagnalis TaxID=6523 RepID=A0AAV2HED1_LYMST